MANQKEEWLPGQLPAEDERLLEQFFMAAREEEIADDGFSQRVMERVLAEMPSAVAAPAFAGLRPSRAQWLSRLWTGFCIVVALGVFTWIGGWHYVLVAVLGFLSHVPTMGQMVQLMLCGAFVTMLAVAEVLRREHITIRSLRV